MAPQVTGTAQRQAWDDGLMPPVEQVGPGLWSIPVPIPNNPLRYVLVYVLELDDGVAIVDAGWDTAEAWEALTGGLDKLGAGVQEVRAVLVTHIHPDHYGLAGRVRQASGAWIGLHPADAEMLGDRYGSVDDLLDDMRVLLLDCGVPEADLEQLSSASMGVRELVNFVQPDVFLSDGDRPDLPGWDLQVVWTPGHSPGHVCFYSPRRRLLLSGDHVLPRISSNIALHVQQRANPLVDYLDALRAVARLGVDEVLPAHEWRFSGLAERVAEQLAHHDVRLDEVVDELAASPGQSCWQLTTGLTWSRPWEQIPPFMRRAANGETLAHLVLLETRGQVRREPGPPTRWYAANPAWSHRLAEGSSS